MRIRKNEGFTLIELMIVVAIIGILAAIAIPNFLKFQCKSKQSEAKTNLSGLFTAEKSFFSEYNTFGTDLVSVNWIPDGSPVYIYGFADVFPAASPQGLPSYDGNNHDTMTASVYNDATGSPRFSTQKEQDLAGNPLANGDLTSTSLNGNGFTAEAAGDIQPQATVQLDQWTMDSTKSLAPQNNDCLN